jgi:glycosyltransferase involved in cell wall biosynthesis
VNKDVEPPIRTLQLGLGWSPEEAGGIQRVSYELLRHLPRSGVEVDGLVAGSSQVARDSAGRVRAFAPADAPLLVRWRALRRELRQMLSERQPDAVISHFALYTFPVLDLVRSHPLVIHFHGPWALESRVEGDWRLATPVKASLERTVYRRGIRFIVLSQSFRDVLHLDYGVSVDRIRVIPGGVDVDRFATGLTRREARERLGWPQDRPLLLAVRRLVRRVGLEDLVAAMALVRKRIPEALLLVAGEGPLTGVLRGQVQSLELTNNVQLLGFVRDQDLPTAYRAADLTIVPSMALEGFGLTVAESLAAGTPALVTPVGGLPEVVRDLSPELVLPATGVGPLSEGLVAALAGGSVLPSVEACRAYARARYDWPVIASRIREVYSEALR